MQKYLDKIKKEENKYNFFSLPNITSIAIDDSGSTEGEIMETQKEIISKIVSKTKCEEILKSNIIAWDNTCTIKSLNKLTSGGLTNPSCIFKKLDKNVKNLLITTDGEIENEEIQKTKDVIENFKNLRNIICILFQENDNVPGELNIPVFYPFLEHSKKMQGIFYLFYYKNKSLYLILKNIPKIYNDKIFKDPPLEITEKTKWEDPRYEYNDLNKIEIYLDETDDGNVYMSNLNQILYLKSLEKEILDKKSKNDSSLVCSNEFNLFMKENINFLIDACIESFSSDNFNRLRNIVSEWKRGLLINIREKEIEDEQIKLYNELMEKKLKIKDTKSEEFINLKNQLILLSKEIYPKVQKQQKELYSKEHDIQQMINDIQERITEEQNKILNNELLSDYTLKSITKISNRVKRATKLKFIENSENWDLKGNPVLCDECLICSGENQPMALLMIDLSIENPTLLEENISDFALNDEINTGTKNVCAIPTGEFCVECAYLMYTMGKHPITRQKIGSVLVLGDPTNRANNKMYLNSICCSIFGCREINTSFQILLGLFDELEKNEIINKSENRFSPKVYEWVHKLVLFNTNGNLLTENYGTNKVLIESMYDIINYKFSPFNEETWLIPLRNKTITSMSIITRCVINEMKNVNNIITNEKEIIKKSIILMRRLLIKIIIMKIITICKNHVNGKDNYLYNKIRFLIENDLFNNIITSIPIINSEKISNFENSKMIKILFNNKYDEYNELIKSIKYFEIFINNKNKDNNDFELITENIITLITLGIYILLNDKNNINNLCKGDEEALKGFLGINKLKKAYTNEENKIIELNKEIFLYGNTKQISSISKDNLIQIIKSISYYSKINLNNDKHINFAVKYASHLYSPCVTKCSCCGQSFITEDEINKLKNQMNIKDIIQNIKNKKYLHMKKFYFTTDFGGFNEFSNIFPCHKIVRIICCKDKYKDLKRPNKNLILEEIKYLKNMNKKIRGNIYNETLIKQLIITSWDFLQRRQNLNKEQLELLNKEIVTFKERVMIEINEPQDDYIGYEENMDGLTEEEIKNLTTNIIPEKFINI